MKIIHSFLYLSKMINRKEHVFLVKNQSILLGAIISNKIMSQQKKIPEKLRHDYIFLLLGVKGHMQRLCLSMLLLNIKISQIKCHVTQQTSHRNSTCQIGKLQSIGGLLVISPCTMTSFAGQMKQLS